MVREESVVDNRLGMCLQVFGEERESGHCSVFGLGWLSGPEVSRLVFDERVAAEKRAWKSSGSFGTRIQCGRMRTTDRCVGDGAKSVKRFAVHGRA